MQREELQVRAGQAERINTQALELGALMNKYDRPGPRYTSYPTAPMFSKNFGSAEYEQAIEESNRDNVDDDISLYLHFPFCDTLCYFCGCTTLITQNRDRIDGYLSALVKEIELLSSRLPARRSVAQMHWGGGTPTYLDPGQIRMVAGEIRRRFNFKEDAEISVEIDPRGLTFDHLDALRQAGFNRVSMGVQDFNEDVQAAVNRNQSESDTRQAIEWSRKLGFSSLNMDLIYGLPLQTVASFGKTLDKVTEIAPDRIAVYNFAYVPWMKPHQKLIHPEDLPSPETKLAMLSETIDRFGDAGYVYIGMDHFAKADDELTLAQKARTLHRNFQGYSTRAGCDLFGLGMSAIGHFNASYAQNAKTLPEYERPVRAGGFATDAGYRMSADDRLREYVIMRLMCDLTLDVAAVEKKFGIAFREHFRESLSMLRPLVDDGLVTESPASLNVTDRGRLFLRNIAMCFDAYLQSQGKKPLFSRTV